MPSRKHDLLTVKWSEGSGQNLAKNKNKSAHWPQFAKMFSKPFVTPEKRKAFDKMSKEQQDNLKKIAGWVSGAQFEGKWRNKKNLLPRNLVTIDIDYAPDHIIELIEMGLLGVSIYVGLWHSSRRHTPDAPRVRAFFPMSRDVSTDEYQAIVRRIGHLIDPEMKIVDPVSYRPAQMMFKPTCSADDLKHYFYHLQSDDSHRVIDPDAILADCDREYGDWRDLSCLPRHPDEEKFRRRADKAEDPLEKQGPVGDFCRAYPDIEVGMERFLEGVYTPGDTDGRYTYSGATSSNGAVIYEGKFLYSHHGTDPVCDQLVNLWDLVRIHRFGDEDTKGDDYESMRDRPSWKAMVAFVKQDEGYRRSVAERKFANINEHFSEVDADEDGDDSEGSGEAETDVADDGDSPAEDRGNRRERKSSDRASRGMGASTRNRDRGDDPGGEEDDSPDGDSSSGNWKSAFDEIEPEEGEPDDYDPFEDLVGSGKGKARSSPKARQTRSFLKPPANWFSRLIEMTENGEIKPTLANIKKILQWDSRFWGKIGFNEFTQRVVLLGDIELRARGMRKLICTDPVNGDQWQDYMSHAFHVIFEDSHGENGFGYGMKVSISDIEIAIESVARVNSFHPIREELLRLEKIGWDGVERGRTIFVHLFGEPDTAYARETAYMLLLASVYRVFEPGKKWDNMAIIKGPQGCRKSTFCHLLPPDPTWAGELHARLDDFGRIAEQVGGAWILEMPELAGFTKTDANHLKSFTRKRKDDWRMAYARHVTPLPRQFTLWGTTNQDRVLKDDTGNRTYLMLEVNVPKIDTDWLIANRDQIWAEVMTWYRAARAAQPDGELAIEYQTEEAKAEALRRQTGARLESHVERLIREVTDWADQPVPLHQLYDEMGLTAAASMESFEDTEEGKQMVRRTCFREKDVREIVFKMDRTTFNPQTDAAIQQVMDALVKAGWRKQASKNSRFGTAKTGIRGIWYERPGAWGEDIKRGYEIIEDDEDEDVI